MALDIAAVRAAFPALERGWAYFDNAGGSLVLEGVANRVRDYMLETSVQTGASYPDSEAASARLAEARARVALLINARRPEEVVFAPSTTVGMRWLAAAMASQFQPGDEVILTDFDHESNIGPWLSLAARGVVFRWWKIDAAAAVPNLDDLAALITSRTRLVCVTHASNILGAVMPIRAIADLVHAGGAKLCVDGVAFAPHRAIDVQALDADFYLFSFYKTYGPHASMLYGRFEELLELDGLYHYFYGKEKVPGKLEPGNPCYELAWGAAGIVDYIEACAGLPGREGVEAFFADVTRHETALGQPLLDWLQRRRGVRIVGDPSTHELRVPTISFVVDGIDPETVVRTVDSARVAIRHGDFHSRRLVEALGLAPKGVIRVSMVHYNTFEEVGRLVEALDRGLS